MFEINFKSDFDKLSRLLTDFERRQLPFATARALTALAGDAKAGAIQQAQSAFDRPTPWTLGAFRTIPATKDSLTAVLLLKDRAGGTEVANEYLRLQEQGGTATPMPSRFGGLGKGRALVSPTKVARLNSYGNLPFRALATLRAQKTAFIGPVRVKSGKTIYGVWRRKTKPKGLTLLIGFNDRQSYKARFGFRDRVQQVAADRMAKRMTDALQQALLTARRN
jgi:hypothetical protein